MKKDIDIKVIEAEAEEVYQTLFKKMCLLLEENDAMVVASTMLAQSLRLYRTIMPDNEFEKFSHFMLEQDYMNIQPFEHHHKYTKTLH